MKNKTLYLTLLLIVPATAFPQTNKGFELFKSKEWGKTWEAFSADLMDETAGATAYYGLAKICEKFAATSLDTAKMGLEYINQSEELYKNASEKAIAFAKKYNLTKATYRSFPTRLAGAAWKGVEASSSPQKRKEFREIFPEYYDNQLKLKEDEAWTKLKISRSFDDLERLLEDYPGFFEKNKTEEVRALRRSIVRNTYEKATDYNTLNLLVLHHMDYLYNDDINMSIDWDRKLWTAFKKDVGIEELGQFMEDHPDHKVNYDCRAKACADALKQKSLKSLVNFIDQYPDSYLGYSTISWHIYNKLANNKTAVNALTATEKNRLDEIIATCRMGNELSESKEPPTDTAAFLALLRRGAPSWRSYILMQTAFDNCLLKKDFDQAAWLIANTRPLFPDFSYDCSYYYFNRSEWFSTLDKILKTSHEKMNPRPIIELNTPGNEILPFVSADGRILYFTGEGRPDGLRREDPYQVAILDTTFGKPELIKGLAGDRNESLLSVTVSGDEAIVFIDGVIHLTKMTEKGWSAPEEIPGIRKNFPWVGKASLNADGSVMVFEAMRSKAVPGKTPDMDIYVAMRNSDGSWKKPFALPKNINTRFRERSPYIHTDGESLYFSSNGHLGLGGMDIFQTKRLDSTWTRWSDPVNMGMEINTIYDDWGFNFSVMADGKTAFFSQNDPAGKNKQELMIAGLPKRVQSKEVKVLQVLVSNLRGVDMQMKDRNGVVLQTVKVNPRTGMATFTALADIGYVTVAPASDSLIAPVLGYNLEEPSVASRPVDTVQVNTVHELAVKKIVFQLSAVRFDRSESVLRPDAMVALNRFYKAIEGKNLRLSIIGHTDNVGTVDANKKLSEERAARVKDYLIEKGYPAALITAIGMGWSAPKVLNTSEANKAINRRVEFKFEE